MIELLEENVKIEKTEANNGTMVNRDFISAPASPKLDFL